MINPILIFSVRQRLLVLLATPAARVSELGSVRGAARHRQNGSEGGEVIHGARRCECSSSTTDAAIEATEERSSLASK
jgi:hypothetical protein